MQNFMDISRVLPVEYGHLLLIPGIAKGSHYCDINFWYLLIHSYRETCKRVIGKQCRPRSDAT